MICGDCGREFKARGRQRLCPACAPQRPLKEPKTCPACGGQFIPRIKAQAYCSAGCRDRQKAAEQQARKRYTVRCTACGAYVGTHKPWPRKAMGILADERMRKAKRNCHEIFDSKWQGQPKAHKKRNDLYAWLAHKLDITEDMCHFGYFDFAMLQKAYACLLRIRDKPIHYDSTGRISFDLGGDEAC